MVLPQSVVGLILSGGKSTRMGGGDKGLMTLAGRPVLAHVLERLAPQVGEIVINANGDPERYADFGVPVIEDAIGDFAGPLAGLHAGLAWMKANRPGAAYLATVAADTPFIPADLVARLGAAVHRWTSIVVARSASGLHPVIGLWPLGLESVLAGALERGARKASAFTEQQRAIIADFPPAEIGGRSIDPFFNINRPEDLAEAEALLAIRAS